jgi:hypothetical protein
MSTGIQLTYTFGTMIVVAQPKERLIPGSYRLPAGQVEFIEKLVKLQILGTDNSAVVRSLLAKAIDDLIQGEFVRKYLESKELLNKE